MKTKITFLIVASFLATVTRAQTKWIFHKSHSGANHTVYADSKNNFGPGMVLIEPISKKPISEIELQYKTTNEIRYPMVKLDSTNSVIRFIDVNDSLIGCDRNYQEYLTQGVLLYDMSSKNYILYQHGVSDSSDFIAAKEPDSLKSWSKHKKTLHYFTTYIYSKNYERIKITYPYILKPKKESPTPTIKDTIETEKVTYTPKIITTKRDSVQKDAAFPMVIKKEKSAKNENEQFTLPLYKAALKAVSSAIEKSKTPLYIVGLLFMIALSLGVFSKIKLLK